MSDEREDVEEVALNVSDLLDDGELKALGAALARGLGRALTHEEATRAAKWAGRVLADHEIVRAAIDGDLDLTFAPDGGMQFRPSQAALRRHAARAHRN